MYSPPSEVTPSQILTCHLHLSSIKPSLNITVISASSYSSELWHFYLLYNFIKLIHLIFHLYKLHSTIAVYKCLKNVNKNNTGHAAQLQSINGVDNRFHTLLLLK